MLSVVAVLKNQHPQGILHTSAEQKEPRTPLSSRSALNFCATVSTLGTLGAPSAPSGGRGGMNAAASRGSGGGAAFAWDVTARLAARLGWDTLAAARSSATPAQHQKRLVKCWCWGSDVEIQPSLPGMSQPGWLQGWAGTCSPPPNPTQHLDACQKPTCQILVPGAKCIRILMWQLSRLCLRCRHHVGCKVGLGHAGLRRIQRNSWTHARSLPHSGAQSKAQFQS